jgi:hypothetical protein
MLHRFFLLLISLGFLFLSGNIGNAAPIFTPAATIIMTGANDEARFDVTEILVSTFWATGTELQPRFQTGSMSFTWIFYLSGSIGWVTFSSGSEYQVNLNCGSQNISDLSTPCDLTGTGWSEVAGDVFFSQVDYIPTLGELSGSVQTWAGDFSLSGIYLPLRPAEFNEDISNLVASDTLTLSISWAAKYGNSGWEINYSPKLATEPRNIPGNSAGVFSGDFTFADEYTITITDPSESTTQLDAIVLPNTLSTTLDTTGTNFIHTFCSLHSTYCPDWSSLSATTITNSWTNIVADGASHYNITIKPRDTYGNRVNIGTIDTISYTGTVSSVQIPIDTIWPATWAWLKGDALIFSWETFSLDPANWVWDTPASIALLWNDIIYDIASVAPTDGIDNTLVLNSIQYNSPLWISSTLTDLNQISFLPAFTTAFSWPTTIRVGEENSFGNTITKNTAISVTPDIFSLLLIGSGSNAAFRDFSTQNIACQAYAQDIPASYAGNCDWQQFMSESFPSILSVSTGTSFTFTGTYAPFTAYPTPERVSYGTFIHYTKANLWNPSNYIWSSDIIYASDHGTLWTSEYQASKVKLLGQNNAQGEYGTIGTSKMLRTKLIDTMRKNSTVLSRNRTSTDYTGMPYLIQNGWTLTITGGTFDDKRTVVVIGGDIHISTGVIYREKPVAIIALTDSSGDGGNIYIDDTVTDIEASLIAERSVFNSGATTHQLYIHGSVISSNTLGDTVAGICPFYVTNCSPTEAASYDFENFRSSYDGSDPAKQAKSARASSYSTTPLIIEYDMRIQHSPPPIVY